MSSGTLHLNAVREAADLVAHGRERLETEIRKARAAGATLVAIANGGDVLPKRLEKYINVSGSRERWSIKHAEERASKTKVEGN